jgi:hypothetical protein
MSDGGAFQKLGFSGLHKDAEELLAELQLSIDGLRDLEVPESERLVSELQSLIDQIRSELRNVGKH